MAHDEEFDPFIAEIARELKRPVALDARFDARVMAALEPAVIPISVHRAAARPWYRRTFSFSLSQVAGLAAAAALVGVVAMNVVKPGTTPGAEMALRADTELTLQPVADVATDENALVQQQFILVAPSASSVALVGDFSDWDASRLKMERVSADGAWSITLPLPPGRYEYQFEVDGKLRVTDPTRPQTSSEFGSANSVVTVERRD
ncbi:MAG: isoamylase early set domain-containing protein [Gemmatimonadota bacterium]